MSLRPLLAVTVALILVLLNAYLVFRELSDEVDPGIAPTEQRLRHEKADEDPLLNLQYVPGQREANLKAFGMDEAMVTRTMKLLRHTEDRHGARIRRLIADAAEPIELGDALCGRTNDSRARYAALRFLVEEKRGERMPLNLARTPLLEQQEWATTSLVQAVYREVELRDDRQDNATLMGIAAILAKKEESVMEGYSPWGRSLAQGWSWDKVVKQHPGIDEHVARYFSMLHLFVEAANEDGGVCGG